MLWFVGALAIAIIAGRYLATYSKWDWESFIASLLLGGFVAIGANGITTLIQDGRWELAATHKIDEIKPDQYLGVESTNDGASVKYRVSGELDSRAAGNYEIVKSDNPHVEIYNNRTSSYWFTVFGGEQKTKIYVPNTNVTLKD